MVTVETIVT